MKISIKILILVFLTALQGEGTVWTSNTATTLPRGHWEMGLFQPLRVGMSETMEWSTHPIINIKMPNLTLKVARKSFRGWKVASRHGFFYPTYLLRVLQMKEVGGIVPYEFQIPHMVAIGNDIFLSRAVGDQLLTLKTGLSIALLSGDLDSRTSIDLPLAYHRLAPFYTGYSLRFGIDLNGHLAGKWDYLIDGDLFLIPGGAGRFAVEHKGALFWNKTPRFQVALGYKLVYGEYPYGTQLRILPYFPIADIWVPFIDFQWTGNWLRDRGK